MVSPVNRYSLPSGQGLFRIRICYQLEKKVIIEPSFGVPPGTEGGDMDSWVGASMVQSERSPKLLIFSLPWTATIVVITLLAYTPGSGWSHFPGWKEITKVN